MGPEAVPGVVPLLRDPEPRVRELAVNTLRQIQFGSGVQRPCPAAAEAWPRLFLRHRRVLVLPSSASFSSDRCRIRGFNQERARAIMEDKARNFECPIRRKVIR